MIKLQVPATSANLGAGFDALGLALQYYNTIEMEESDQIEISAPDTPNVPTDERNLIYISAKDLFEVCGKKLEGLKIIQHDKIPMTRGLGSSSACIVAGLVGANTLLGNPLNTDDLVDLAAQIEGHPDNTAPALLGGIVTAVFDGRRVHWVNHVLHGGFIVRVFCVLMNSSNVKCLLSLVFSIVVALDDFDVLVEPEDGASQQERLRHIIEQSGSHILDADHLVGYERDTAHDEQHRTGILRDFESRVFHRFLNTNLEFHDFLFVFCPLSLASRKLMTSSINVRIVFHVLFIIVCF